MRLFLLILLLIVTMETLVAQRNQICSFNGKSQSSRLANTFNTNILPDTNIIIRIPVVFHVYHTGQSEGTLYNFSESILKKVIYNLNALFRARNKYTETLDSKIEFYLLSDSLGCSNSTIPTNGIKRANLANLSPWLYQAYQQTGISPSNKSFYDKEVNQLSSNPVNYKCLNIRLIPDFRELAGYVASGELGDVMLRSSVVQDAALNGNTSFAHELGHVLGLAHTFYGQDENCIDGDGLSDTDIHKKSDFYDPDDLNFCTGRRKGKIIYNIMGYNFGVSNNFTKMQINKMRETLYGYYYPNVSPVMNLFSSPNLANAPIIACNFIATQSSTNFSNGVFFNLNTIKFENKYERNQAVIDYSCSVKTELSIGQTYSFSFTEYNASPLYYKIFIDYNNDGDFNDANEEIATGQKVGNPVQGNFSVPNTAVTNSWLRLRIVRSNSNSFNSCGTSGYGTAIDFSIKVLSNCVKSNSPVVSNQAINHGQSASLTSTGCSGQTKWYSKGVYLGLGNSFNTGVLLKDTYFQATCSLNSCESLPKYVKVTVNQSLIISNLSNTNYCINTNISIPFTTTLPNNQFYTVMLRKGNSIIASNIIQFQSPTTIGIPIDFRNYEGGSFQTPIYGTDYNIQIETQDPLTNKKIVSNSVFINIGAIAPYNHRIVKNVNEIYDINSIDNYTPDYLCTGKSKIYYGQVSDFRTNKLTNEGLIFNWKKDGVSIGATTTGQLTVNSAGVYSFDVTQAGCNGTSSEKLLYTDSNIYNSPKIIGTDYSCMGTPKELYSDYSTASATYQWKQNGINIQGATQSNFMATQSGNYNVDVQDVGCNINEGKEKMVSFSTSLPIKIASFDNDSTLCFTTAFGIKYSNSIRMEDNFGGGVAISNEYQFQWQKNGIDIPNQTKNYIDIGYRSYYDNGLGIYKLRKKQGVCTSYSNSINISESNINPKPIISFGKTVDICTGNMGLYSNLANAGEWYKDNVLVGNSYYFNVTSSGIYKHITNGYSTCRNESDPVSISIGSTINPKIKFDDNKRNLCGTNDYVVLAFDCYNSSVGFSCQWLKNGTEITGSTYASIFVSEEGTYSLRVTNGSCTAVSNQIVVTSNNSDLILKTSDFNLGCTNRSAKIELSGMSKFNYSDNFVWKRNGVIISDEKSPWIYTNNNGSYSVEYNNNSGCSIQSNSVSIIKGGNSTLDPMFSTNSGNWNTNTVWSCGRTPTITDNVTIFSGHTVTIPSGQTGFVYNLINNGILVNAGNLKIRVP